jgi:VanZ family protein
MNPHRRRSLYRLALALCIPAVAFLALTTLPQSEILGDKAKHLLAFLVLGLLGLGSWPQKSLHVLIGLATIGCFMEVLQALVPTRQPGWQDVMVNLAGLMGAWTTAHPLRAKGLI